VDDIGALMGFVLYVGAARAAARGQDLQVLRATVLPALQEYREGRATREDVKAAVRVALGPNWEPRGDWKLWIDKLEGKG
jgi:hypothetical protein